MDAVFFAYLCVIHFISSHYVDLHQNNIKNHRRNTWDGKIYGVFGAPNCTELHAFMSKLMLHLKFNTSHQDY